MYVFFATTFSVKQSCVLISSPVISALPRFSEQPGTRCCGILATWTEISRIQLSSRGRRHVRTHTTGPCLCGCTRWTEWRCPAYSDHSPLLSSAEERFQWFQLSAENVRTLRPTEWPVVDRRSAGQCPAVNERICRDSFIRSRATRCIAPRRCGPIRRPVTAADAAAVPVIPSSPALWQLHDRSYFHQPASGTAELQEVQRTGTSDLPDPGFLIVWMLTQPPKSNATSGSSEFSLRHSGSGLELETLRLAVSATIHAQVPNRKP